MGKGVAMGVAMDVVGVVTSEGMVDATSNNCDCNSYEEVAEFYSS